MDICQQMMRCLNKASGFTSGDDALDDREVEDEMVKSTADRHHGSTKVQFCS